MSRAIALNAPEAVGLLVTAALRVGGTTDLHRYWQLACGLRLKLGRQERQALAWAAAEACDAEPMEAPPTFALPSIGPSTPPVTRGDPIEEAAAWCNLATVEERKAYLFACFVSLPPKDRAKFLGFAKRRASA
jgi:hypothetical protein